MADKDFKYTPLEGDDALDAARKRDTLGEAPPGTEREHRFGKDQYEINVQSGHPEREEPARRQDRRETEEDEEKKGE